MCLGRVPPFFAGSKAVMIDRIPGAHCFDDAREIEGVAPKVLVLVSSRFAYNAGATSMAEQLDRVFIRHIKREIDTLRTGAGLGQPRAVFRTCEKHRRA